MKKNLEIVKQRRTSRVVIVATKVRPTITTNHALRRNPARPSIDGRLSVPADLKRTLDQLVQARLSESPSQIRIAESDYRKRLQHLQDFERRRREEREYVAREIRNLNLRREQELFRERFRHCHEVGYELPMPAHSSTKGARRRLSEFPEYAYAGIVSWGELVGSRQRHHNFAKRSRGARIKPWQKRGRKPRTFRDS